MDCCVGVYGTFFTIPTVESYGAGVFFSARTLIAVKLLNCFDGGIGTNMCKAAHPSGGMGSLNPCRWSWRGERLHHHGDGGLFGR